MINIEYTNNNIIVLLYYLDLLYHSIMLFIIYCYVYKLLLWIMATYQCPKVDILQLPSTTQNRNPNTPSISETKSDICLSRILLYTSDRSVQCVVHHNLLEYRVQGYTQGREGFNFSPLGIKQPPHPYPSTQLKVRNVSGRYVYVQLICF